MDIHYKFNELEISGVMKSLQLNIRCFEIPTDEMLDAHGFDRDGELLYLYTGGNQVIKFSMWHMFPVELGEHSQVFIYGGVTKSGRSTSNLVMIGDEIYSPQTYTIEQTRRFLLYWFPELSFGFKS